MKSVRTFFALMLCLSLLGSFGQIAGVSAQDTTPTVEASGSPLPGSIRERCADTGEVEPELGFREIREDESATVTPPITEMDDCDTMKEFTRVLILDPEEKMLYIMPRGRFAFEVQDGAFSVLLRQGNGMAYHGDCRSPQPQNCTIEGFEGGGQEVILEKGDSVYMDFFENDAGADPPLEFVLGNVESPSGSVSGNRMLLAPAPSMGSGSGSGTVTAALWRGWCDTSAC